MTAREKMFGSGDEAIGRYGPYSAVQIVGPVRQTAIVHASYVLAVLQRVGL
jgi:hypothetical protein